MTAGQFDDVTDQYRQPDPLQVRINTHQTYQERAVDLDREARLILGLAGHESVLDVGCGPGLFLSHLRSHGHHGRLTGLDQSAGMISALSAGMAAVEGVVADAQSLPFQDGEFDWVVARHMLYHVPDIELALAEMRRIARRGLLVSTGSRNSMAYLMGTLAKAVTAFGMTPEKPVMRRFCMENAGEWLAGAGMDFEAIPFANRLVFRSAGPIVDYVLSCLPSYRVNHGSDIYEQMRAWLTERVERDVAAAGGEIQDPTSVAFYVVRLE